MVEKGDKATGECKLSMRRYLILGIIVFTLAFIRDVLIKDFFNCPPVLSEKLILVMIYNLSLGFISIYGAGLSLLMIKADGKVALIGLFLNLTNWTTFILNLW